MFFTLSLSSSCCRVQVCKQCKCDNKIKSEKFKGAVLLELSKGLSNVNHKP